MSSNNIADIITTKKNSVKMPDRVYWIIRQWLWCLKRPLLAESEWLGWVHRIMQIKVCYKKSCLAVSVNTMSCLAVTAFARSRRCPLPPSSSSPRCSCWCGGPRWRTQCLGPGNTTASSWQRSIKAQKTHISNTHTHTHTIRGVPNQQRMKYEHQMNISHWKWA